MLYALTLLPAAVLAGTAEITTSDVRKGASFDNIKASWGKALSFGDVKTDMKCNYDYNARKDFLKDVNFKGNLLDGDISVSYDVTHDFNDKNTGVKLSAVTSGTTLKADYDCATSLKEVSAHRQLDVADRKVDVTPSWLVKAKTARVKMMSALGDSNKLDLQVDYTPDGSATSYELGYARNLESGKDVSARYTGNNNELKVKLVDSTFEPGVTWTAQADVPVQSGNLLDSAKLSLKRAWSW